MAATATSSSTFLHFSSLPSELRNRIWHDALPDKDEPALCFYKKGCWCPRHLSESDEEYDPDGMCNLEFEFRHDLLDHVQVEVPLFFVNREARGIALAWVREQGIALRFCKDRQCYYFVRSFDPMYDTLYLALDRWNDFCFEPDGRLFEPDLLGQMVHHKGQTIPRIAVPEALLPSEAAALSEILESYFYPAVLFIIIGAQPDMQLNDEDTRMRRWELGSTRGRAFFWNNGHRGFDFGEGECIGDEALYRRIEEASKELAERLAETSNRVFEIRPVLAVTK